MWIANDDLVSCSVYEICQCCLFYFVFLCHDVPVTGYMLCVQLRQKSGGAGLYFGLTDVIVIAVMKIGYTRLDCNLEQMPRA
jgi:hypothetical protein